MSVRWRGLRGDDVTKLSPDDVTTAHERRINKRNCSTSYHKSKLLEQQDVVFAPLVGAFALSTGAVRAFVTRD